jgi:hypothetical protein
MKKDMNKKGMSAGGVVAIGAGVAALAAASYYFFGPEGKKNQKKMKGWMIKMKGEIIDKMEDAQDMTESAYHAIVDTVSSAYQKSSKVAATDVADYVAVLKKQWKGISGSLKKPAKKTASKVVKKAGAKVTKAAKKATKKK